jgi:UDP-N-acetylglucosamine acyltransferase
MQIDVNRAAQFNKSDKISIHPTAIIAKGAEIGSHCIIGPHAVVGPQVRLGNHVQIGPGAIVEGRTTVGEETKIFAYATVGMMPQDLKYRGEEAELVVGKRNAIREYVNISIGTEGGGNITRIGDDNLFMVYTHIAHDCMIGNHCIFANSVQIAGHVEVGDGVVFGGMSGAHQFTRFGDLAMVGAAAVVVQDVPPFCMVQGDRAQINGLNVVGLRRRNLGSELFGQIKAMYRTVFNENLTLEDAIKAIEEKIPDSQYRASFVGFLKKSARGICR